MGTGPGPRSFSATRWPRRPPSGRPGRIWTKASGALNLLVSKHCRVSRKAQTRRRSVPSHGKRKWSPPPARLSLLAKQETEVARLDSGSGSWDRAPTLTPPWQGCSSPSLVVLTSAAPGYRIGGTCEQLGVDGHLDLWVGGGRADIAVSGSDRAKPTKARRPGWSRSRSPINLRSAASGPQVAGWRRRRVTGGTTHAIRRANGRLGQLADASADPRCRAPVDGRSPLLTTAHVKGA